MVLKLEFILVMAGKRAKIMDVKPARIQTELNENKVVVVTGFQGISEYNDVTTIGRGGSDTSAGRIGGGFGFKGGDIYTDVDGVYTTDPRRVSSAKKLSVVSYDEMLELASMGGSSSSSSSRRVCQRKWHYIAC